MNSITKEIVINEIEEFRKVYGSKIDNLIIAGDFNLTYQEILKEANDDYFYEFITKLYRTENSNTIKPNKKRTKNKDIDHIFSTKPFTSSLVYFIKTYGGI